MASIYRKCAPLRQSDVPKKVDVGSWITHFGSSRGDIVVAAIGTLKSLFLTRLSKPVSDRVLYRVVRRQRPRRMLLLGLGDGRRAVRLIELAQRCAATDDLLVAGVDLFECRPDGASTSLSLKEAYRTLRETGAQVQLVPGDPFSALAHMANSLPDIDLMLVDADQDPDAVSQAWFYAPRMLHSASLVLVERGNGSDKRSGHRLTKFESFDRAAIDQMASLVRQRRAA